LDAFEQILIDGNERAATMDATARAAGVSKGGLLYHFATKDALEAGMIDRLDGLVDEDVAAIAAASEGAVAYYLRSSVLTADPLDRAMLAVSRLAQGGSVAAGTALQRTRDRWADALRPHVRDEAALNLVLLVSDGLYFNNLLEAETAMHLPVGADLDALIALVLHAVAE
jgi:AcrR family transcriptional regulator